MIVDSSAIVAIFGYEAEQASFLQALGESADSLRVSAATYVEVSVMLDRRRIEAAGLDEFLADWEIEIVPLSVEQARLGRDGFERFGKGRHEARLNFGDCFSYALAKESGEPLLCKGEDFARTDLQVVRPG